MKRVVKAAMADPNATIEERSRKISPYAKSVLTEMKSLLDLLDEVPEADYNELTENIDGLDDIYSDLDDAIRSLTDYISRRAPYLLNR